MDLNIDEKRYKAHLKRLEQYRPLDDDFMRELFRDNIPLSEMVLRIITGIRKSLNKSAFLLFLSPE